MTSDSSHGSHRGCKIVNRKTPSVTKRKLIDAKYCLTHKVELCGSCMWEWGHGIAEETRTNKMRLIPQRLRDQMAVDPYYQVCARAKDGGCHGRITWDHCFIYQNKQINEAWAILPVCVYHHLGNGFDRNEHQRIALSRATEEDLAKYPNYDWSKRRNYLNNWIVLKSQ